MLFFSSNGTVRAAWNLSLTPVTFYTATRPSQPMAWYPDSDPECFLPPFCGNFFYAPNIIFENEKYKMWATVDDMIFYFESTDGKTWTNGRKIMSAIQTNWENDANCRLVNGVNLCGGLSNPVVVKGVTSGWTYTMYYTAGPTVNTTTNGGLGVAFSNDGINWTRFSGNPIRRFPGGGTFAANAIKIGTKRYVFFYGGGNFARNDSPPLQAAIDLGNGTNLGQDITTFGGTKTVYPITYDVQTNGCWLYDRGVTGSDWGTAGPTKFQIYKDSNCLTNLGTKVAEINSTLTGNVGNGIAGAGIKERDGNGQVVSGLTSLQLYFGSGDVWAGWQPKSVTLTFSGDSPLGALNTPSCDEIFGWALDKDDATKPINVDFYYDVLDSEHFLKRVLADSIWSGICSYLKITQNCNDNHKFSLNTPTILKNGKTHTIYAFGINLSGTIGGNSQLAGSPKTITCSPTSGISQLRQLLGTFTHIFDYNKLMGNFGK